MNDAGKLSRNADVESDIWLGQWGCLHVQYTLFVDQQPDQEVTYVKLDKSLTDSFRSRDTVTFPFNPPTFPCPPISSLHQWVYTVSFVSYLAYPTAAERREWIMLLLEL